MKSKSYRLTEEQVAALISAVGYAVADRQSYFSEGDTYHDYGDEWPEVARGQAEEFDQMGLAMLKLGSQHMSEQCAQTASQLRQSAKEYEELEESK